MCRSRRLFPRRNSSAPGSSAELLAVSTWYSRPLGAQSIVEGTKVTNRRSLLRASAATWLGASLAIAKTQNVMRRVALLGIVSAGPSTQNRLLFQSRLGE